MPQSRQCREGPALVRVDGGRSERADPARAGGDTAARSFLFHAMPVSAMYSEEKIKQVREKLRGLGVKYCIGAYVDIHGVPKAKVVPLDHLHHMAQGSERYTGYALDGLGQAPNEDEIASVPDLDHVIQLPWEPKLAWMQADKTFRCQPSALN